nr:phosphoglycerate dehydrogenase [Chitinophagales bacterium]
EEAQVNISEDVTAKLIGFLETGVTSGSHTVPALHLPQHPDAHRILHIHRNTPGVLSAINSVFSSSEVNIVGQYLNTNTEIGYAVIDVNRNLTASTIEALRNVPHTIKMRVVY